jgi:hypothetical protein
MLTLSGTLRAATILGGGVNKKTGEVIPPRSVIQIEATDHRGLAVLETLTVPTIDAWKGQEGQQVAVPVRAWAPDGKKVGFVYEGSK